MKLLKMNSKYLKNCIFIGVFSTLLINMVKGQNVYVEPNFTYYSTLSDAFNGINSGQHTGSITVNVVGNTIEPASGAILNASGNGGSYTSILIQPSGGIARTISGSINAGSALIVLNGADNVTINGLNAAGNSLTINNTTVSSTEGTSTILIKDDATNNVITNCSVLGASTISNNTPGGNILFGSTIGTVGNDNNTISYCNIGPSGSNQPTKCIFMGGISNINPGTANSGNQILNNNIFDFFSPSINSSGIEIISGTVNTIISNNKFYQTSSRILTTVNLHHRPINVNNASGADFNINNNTIGYSNSNGTGIYSLEFAPNTTSGSFVPIFISASTAALSYVENNTIAKINISGNAIGTLNNAPFKGIYVSSGLVNANGNNIGSMNSTNNIVCSMTSLLENFIDIVGIYNSGTSTFVSSNNNIGGIYGTTDSGAIRLFGIFYNTTVTAQWICNNNIIGGSIDGSFYVPNFTNNTQINGIRNTKPSLNATGNIIRNLKTDYGSGSEIGASVVGISLGLTSANHTLINNQIYNLINTNTNLTTNVYGIYFNGGNSNVIENNIIHSLTLATSSGASGISGIYSASGSCVFRNNMIAIGSGASFNVNVTGVVEYAGANTYLNNSFYIGGSSTTGSNSSYCLYNAISGTNRIYRNNIFSNGRTRSGSSSSNHYAMYVSGTGQNPVGLTINNNIYHVSGVGGSVGYYNGSSRSNLDSWRLAIGQDSFSISGDPKYINPTATIPNLHIQQTSPTVAESSGVNLGVVQDFDGETRMNLTPVDIGADAGNFVSNFCPGTPNGGTISPALVQKCGEQAYTMYASSSYGVGYSYQWKVSSSSGGPYSNVIGGTGANTQTYTTSLLSFGTYYYVLETTCSATGIFSSSSQLTLTISSNPILTVSQSNPIYCIGSSSPVQLTAMGATSYAWSPATGLSSTTIANPTANPTQSTTYTCTGTSNGCSTTNTVVVRTQNLPIISSVTSTPNNICQNESSQLNAVPDMSAKYYSIQASLGTYSPVSGTMVTLSNNDDSGVTNLPIGFNFRYNNVVYSTFGVSSNGYMGFGPSLNVVNANNSLGTNANIIAPFWDDNYMNGGNIKYLTEGTTPNRITTIQWTGMHVAWETYPTIDCQVKLSEMDSSITFIYGPTSASLISASASIGISTASGNYASVTPISPVANTLTSSTTANNSINSAVNIPSGTTYKFTPPGFNYLWAPVTFLNSNSIKSPMANSISTPITYVVTATTSSGCSNTSSVSIILEGTVVKNSSNSGFNSLRNVVQCASENSIITYDQPNVTGTVLTTPLQITKNLTFKGLSSTQRPLITLPTTGISILPDKILSLDNIDIKSVNNKPTFSDFGAINIIGQTIIKAF